MDGAKDHASRAQPIFVEAVCAEENLQVNIGNEHYMLNGFP